MSTLDELMASRDDESRARIEERVKELRVHIVLPDNMHKQITTENQAYAEDLRAHYEKHGAMASVEKVIHPLSD